MSQSSQIHGSLPNAGADQRGLPPGYAFKPDWEISPVDAKARLSSGGAVFVDVRRDDEIAICRIQGAVHLPLNMVEQRADELEADGGGRDHEIIVYCHHGVRSLRATAALRAKGFTHVRSLAAGIDQWSVAIDPTVKRY